MKSCHLLSWRVCLDIILSCLQRHDALSVLYSAGNYYYIHRRAHLEPDWAMRKIPWHYDHHMNSNQDANWCMTQAVV